MVATGIIKAARAFGENTLRALSHRLQTGATARTDAGYAGRVFRPSSTLDAYRTTVADALNLRRLNALLRAADAAGSAGFPAGRAPDLPHNPPG